MDTQKMARPDTIYSWSSVMSTNSDAELHFQEGKQLFENSQDDQALKELSTAIEQNPGHYRALTYRGRVFREKNLYDDAIADFTKAIEVNAHYADAYFYRGVCLDELQKYQEAVADYHKTLEIDSHNKTAKKFLKEAEQKCPEIKPLPQRDEEKKPTAVEAKSSDVIDEQKQTPLPLKKAEKSNKAICEKCGTENPADARVCMSCATPMAPATETTPEPTGSYMDIKGFNLGAFLISTIWSFCNGLIGMGAILTILILLMIGISFLTLSMGPGVLVIIVPLYIARVGIAIYLGIKGNELAWATRSHKNVEQFKKAQRTWAIVGAIIFISQLLLPAIKAIPNYMQARSRSDIVACTQGLMNVGSALETHISEEGSLAGVNSVDDVCHHLILGADEPKDCVGTVEKRIDKMCKPESFNLTVLDDVKYEIKAKPKGSDTTICVTESGVDPEDYDQEPLGCPHEIVEF